MTGVMGKFRPHALLMQLGADSLCYDKLGQFNLSVKGHSRCLDFMLGFAVPTMMVGGGGYTI
jgi:acetoin utilization deacetylase AcuC-like enzyme